MDIYYIASILLLASHIVISIMAFRDEVVDGILTLLIPGYVLYYGFRKMNVPGKSLFMLIYLLSAGVYLWGVFRPQGSELVKLIPQQDVEELLGETVTSPQAAERSTTKGSGQIIQYSAEGSNKSLTVLMVRGCSGLDDIGSIDTSGLLPVSSLSGIADEAFEGRHKTFGRKGDVCIWMASGGFGDNIDATMKRRALLRSALTIAAQ